MDQHEPPAATFRVPLEVFEVAEELAGEGTAEMAKEHQGNGATVGGFGEGLPGGEAELRTRFLEAERLRGSERVTEMSPGRGPQDGTERGKPDDVVEDHDPGRGEWKAPLPDGDQEPEGADPLCEESHQHDRPMANRSEGGDEVADPEDPENDPDLGQGNE